MGTRMGIAGMVRVACLAAFVTFAAPERSGAGTIRGTVTDRDGKPAAGAKVWAAKLVFPGASEVREAVADDAGGFAIEAGPGAWGLFALRGTEGGRAPWTSLPTIEEGKPDPKPVAIRLGPPTTFRGRLRDAETGEPIARGAFALDDARRVPLDAEGRFEAPGLALAGHEAYPLCPGYERRRILFDTTARPDAELELTLPRAGKVVGRVLDERGRPIPGAIVGLKTSGSTFSGSALWEPCGEDGRYAYDGRSLGRAGRLSALAPGYIEEERSDVVVHDASSPATLDFTLRTDPTKAAKPVVEAGNRRTISGTVLGPEGKPVAGALVRWGLQTDSNAHAEARTDASGHFRLEHMPAEANVLSVMTKGLAPSFPLIDSGEDREVKVDLTRGATIRGRVVDEAGAPIEGAWVAPRIDNPKPNWGGFVYLDELQATVDRDGRFTLEGIPEGAVFDVIAEGMSAVRGRALASEDESRNVVTLPGEGEIRGRVLAPTGKPVRNFRVQVGIPKGSRPGDPVGGYFAGYSGTGVSFTRDDGTFTLTGLTAGNLHSLRVIADGLGVGEADRVAARSSRLPAPDEPLTITLGLPHTLRVRVFAEGGKAIESARVTVIQNEGAGGFQWGLSESTWADSVTAKVNPAGWAEFPALPFRAGTVAVRARGYSRRKLDWAKDEEEFLVDLEPEARLTGTVRDEAGKPIPGSQILLSWGEGEMMSVPIDETDGHFSADELPAGRYVLNVTAPLGPGLASETLTLEAGQTLTKAIVAKRPARAPGPGR